MESKFENRRFLFWFCVVEIVVFLIVIGVYFVGFEVGQFFVNGFPTVVWGVVQMVILGSLFCWDVLWFWFVTKNTRWVTLKFCYLGFKVLLGGVLLAFSFVLMFAYF